MSVPTALFGALLFINFGVTSLNIYSQVGLVTLLGLISKHGILMVQFANDEQRAGKPKRAAIIEAAAVRLRPILMTTAAMVLGVVPLVIASGAGAAGRKAMGWVILDGPFHRHDLHALHRARRLPRVGGRPREGAGATGRRAGITRGWLRRAGHIRCLVRAPLPD